jgi:septal ring factor EnvC (AmiA/AmiB activator)
MNTVKQQVSAEYQKLCSELGDIQYRLEQYKSRKKEIMQELAALNTTNAKVLDAEIAEAKQKAQAGQAEMAKRDSQESK